MPDEAASAASAASPEAAAPAGDLPLFDERYRWVLLHSLRWLRDVAGVDLDEADQLEAAYGFLSGFVQEAVRRRGLLSKLDPMKVAALAESSAARSTVQKILLDWLGTP